MAMEHMTDKLVRPKNYRPKAVIEAERKMREKMEKQKIREELLKPDPISDFDTKIYSGYLAQQSSNSKSELQIKEEKEQKK